MRLTNRTLGSGFEALFYGSLISNTGDGIRLAAFPLLAADLTSSPLLVSAVAAAQFLPWVTFAPVGGALVDRSDRRRMILVTQAWRGLVMAAIGLLVLTDLVAIWHLYVVAFAITVGEILVDPAIVALVPTVVEDEHLDSANGRIAGVEILTNDFAGGPVGATVFGFAPWLPFMIDGASYLGSLLPFSRLPGQADAVESAVRRYGPAPSVLAESKQGFLWLRRHPVLGPFTAAQVLYYFGFASGFSLLVLLVTVEVGASAMAFGAILGVGAAGAFVGSLAAGRMVGAIGRRATLSGAVFAQGLTLAAMALADTAPQLAVVWFLNGLPAGVQRPVARSMQQRLTPNDLLGRVNVSARVFTRGIIIVGAIAGGALATVAGVRSSFVAGGAIELLAATMMWLVLGGRSDVGHEDDWQRRIP